MASEAEKASSCQEHFQIRPYFAQVGRTERSMAAAGAMPYTLGPDPKKTELICGFGLTLFHEIVFSNPKEGAERALQQ